MKPNLDPPLVTIGISTYQRADSFLPAALRSALAQSYPALEVVVCDNASEDGTEALVRSYGDPRLHYHRHPANIGANANFNACLRLANGRYFLLLHDDDELHAQFVERAMAALDDSEPGVLLGGSRVIDEWGETRSLAPPPEPGLDAAELFLSWFARRTSFYLCSTIFHTDRLRQVGGFATPEDLFQDVTAIALLAARYGHLAVPGMGGSFRRHGANKGTSAEALAWARDAQHLLSTLMEELPERADDLFAAGAPYLANKCYRYVADIPSASERRRTYRDIHRRFGRTYAPWRFLLTQQRKRLRSHLGRLVRSAAPGSAART